MSHSFFRLPVALVVLLSLWMTAVSGSSAPPRPLKRVAHPSTIALEILPRRPSSGKTLNIRSSPDTLTSPTLRHSDTFRLTIRAFGTVYYLHLRPNDHLLHSTARINHYTNGPDGRAVLYRTEPLLRENVRAYWGEVIEPEHTAARLREDAAGVIPRPNGKTEMGWARIIVHHQGDVDLGVAPSFEGAFSVDGIVHHITTKDNYLRNKLHLDPEIAEYVDDGDSGLVIFRDSDLISALEEGEATRLWNPFGEESNPLARTKRPQTCSHDSLAYNTDPQQNPVLRKIPRPAWYDPRNILDGSKSLWDESIVFEKRDDVAGGGSTSDFVNSIGQTAGCSTTQKVVYMGVAADCVYTMKYGSTQNATTQILNNWNMASSLYKTTFNVSLGIIHIDMHDATCPSPPDVTRPWNTDCGNVTLNDRLALFSQWRGTIGDDGTGLWHLMSGCPTGTEVGVAWLGTICQQQASGSGTNIVSGTAVSTQGRTEWEVVAHEIGHNFGAIHDCQDGCALNSTTSCCPMTASSCNANDAFIMSPVTSPSQMQFSACSIGNICSLMQANAANKVNTSCIQDPDPSKQTISLQMCGNGIVEAGEDCDPGIGSSSACCNAATCKFKTGAVCDPSSSPCCTAGCAFAPTTQICRPSMDSKCDTAEMCTGNSSSCPADVFAPNGQSCGDNGLACANGHCTSESQQCQIVGASMSLTTACPRKSDSTCQVSCQDPTNPNQCVLLQSQLIDGSPCGFGGTCSGGNCVPGSILDTAKAWYVDNLQISIPVSVAAGIVALLMLWAFIVFVKRCCCGGRDGPKSPRAAKFKGQRIASWTPAPVSSSPEPLLVQIPESQLAIPASLRAGSDEAYRQAPPMAHTRDRSLAGGARGGGTMNQFPSSNRQNQFGPSGQDQYGQRRGRVAQGGDHDQSNWVDPIAWNGR
ncbi:hypothetical protein BD410DRAFT_781544 [Rickenella mellea]|uniref:Disintegrin and metalloproteinase domain-containing protein B n=1 Tax=Rickenella mellea TaxID=50990 RepID=A0A4Y7QPZ6_9AGAM|nr:hypothetical protein BD410DRAFT_781544 [Rickenella mellea]